MKRQKIKPGEKPKSRTIKVKSRGIIMDTLHKIKHTKSKARRAPARIMSEPPSVRRKKKATAQLEKAREKARLMEKAGFKVPESAGGTAKHSCPKGTSLKGGKCVAIPKKAKKEKWYPGKKIKERRAKAKKEGKWYLGKHTFDKPKPKKSKPKPYVPKTSRSVSTAPQKNKPKY